MRHLQLLKAVPAKLVAIAAIVLVLAGSAGAYALVNRDMSSDHPKAQGQQTASDIEKTETPTGTEVKTEGQVKGAEATKPAAAGGAKTSSNQAAAKAAPSTGKSTAPPMAGYTPYVQPPLAVTAVNITGNFTIPPGTCGAPSFAYGYVMTLNGGKGPATIQTTWEYEMTGPGQFTPSITPILQGYPVQGSSLGEIRSNQYDAPTYFSTSTASGYRARLHVTSPNNIYSNWVNIPQAVNC